MNLKRSKLLTFLTLLGLWSSTAWSGWPPASMTDPQDGKFDMSQYLASAKGFLPIPIIITEPAVGFGLGAAVAYFHPQKHPDLEVGGRKAPPSISVVMGAKTENGTYVYGFGHLGVWKDDHIRYTGALGKMNVNMAFYLDRPNYEFLNNGIDFNINGMLLYQQMQFRLKETDWWLGVNYIFSSADSTFDLGEALPPELPDPAFKFDLAALGVFVEYDSRNTIFTPSSGMSARFEYKNFGSTWGGDYDFNDYIANVLHYTPIGDYSSLGLRLNGETVNGDVPYFAYPFVSMRGIPAMRYQGKSVGVAELEYLWGVTPRWSLVFFGGVGKTTEINRFRGEGETVAAGGIGFRYRLAKAFGLQAGIDVARGPEETSVYLTVGSAWSVSK